ncbi:MAG: ABC transporter substrate-binding protein [Myxococcota bacterium]
MKGPARWIALVTILGAIAAACTGNGGDTDPSQGSSVEPAKGGTLHIGVSSEPASAAMDPAKEYYSLSWEQMRCCLLRTLYSTNGQAMAQGGLELRPDLAASLPEVSEDGLTYTFAIKRGVKFAPPFQNEEITADDFIRALEREATPAASSGGYPFYYSPIVGFDDFGAGKANEIAGLKAIDDHTLEMTLSELTGDLGWRMAMPATAPIPPNGNAPLGAAEGHNVNYGRFLVASGPYMFEGSEDLDFSVPADDQEPVAGYIPGRSITMVRNPSWTEASDDLRAAYADSIEIQIGGAVADLYDKIQTGDLDYVFDPPEAAALKQYSTDPSLKDRLHVNPTSGTSYASMNLGAPPFDDIYVRKAMNLIWDKAGGRQLSGGPLTGVNAGHIFPNGLLNNVLADYNPYATPNDSGDIGLAQEQMKQSKYDTNHDGLCDAPECEDVLAIYVSDSATGRKIAALTQQSLEEIGITLELKGLSQTPMYAKCGDMSQQVPVCLQLSWGQDYPDPYTFGPPLFGGAAFGALYPGCCNYAGVGATEAEMSDWGYSVTSVPSVDDQLNACKVLAVGDERTQCWADLDKYLMEEVVPWVPKTFLNQDDIVSARVTSYSFDEFGGLAALDRLALEPGED